MPEAPTRSNKLNIYLLKSGLAPADFIDPDAKSVDVPGVGVFYYKDSHTYRPDWLETFFGPDITRDLRIFSSSARGVLIVQVEIAGATPTFAVTFGLGLHLLNEGVLEDRFGLKAVLNSVDRDAFRSIGKTTLGSIPKHSREQMGREVAPAEFGLDIEQDLISSVTARSRDPALGKTITGKDNLSLSVRADINNIKTLLAHCYSRYLSTDYKAEFDFIDQISEVRNRTKADALNAQLIGKLRAREFDKVWMAVPEVVEWSDAAGFRYLRPKRADLHNDLHIADFIDSLGGREIAVEVLREAPVFLVSASTGNATRWSALRCTYAELEDGESLYVLNGGKWYQIARGFTEQVLNDFNAIEPSSLNFPACTFTVEAEYNQATAAQMGMCCMDEKLIMHGGGHSRIEFCDLLSADKKLIHIKRYGGSSLLSHLFAQGIVSGELFAADREFREKVNDELPAAFRLPDPAPRPNLGEYEVVYGVISQSSSALDLPFFSKVSLRNARRRLESYGYKVRLQKIDKAGPP